MDKLTRNSGGISSNRWGKLFSVFSPAWPCRSRACHSWGGRKLWTSHRDFAENWLSCPALHAVQYDRDPVYTQTEKNVKHLKNNSLKISAPSSGMTVYFFESYMSQSFFLTCCTSLLRIALTLALMLSWPSAVSWWSKGKLRPKRWCREPWSGIPSVSSVKVKKHV